MGFDNFFYFWRVNLANMKNLPLLVLLLLMSVSTASAQIIIRGTDEVRSPEEEPKEDTPAPTIDVDVQQGESTSPLKGTTIDGGDEPADEPEEAVQEVETDTPSEQQPLNPLNNMRLNRSNLFEDEKEDEPTRTFTPTPSERTLPAQPTEPATPEPTEERVDDPTPAPQPSRTTTPAPSRPATPPPAADQMEDVPPFAEPGKCYARCYIPDEYDYREVRVVDRPQIIKKIRLPELIRTVYDTVVVTPRSVRTVEVPAEYEYIEERIMVEPATTKWVKGKADAGCLSDDPEDCQVMCLVEVPAQYRTVRRKVLKHAAHTRTVEIPMEYKIVAKEVVVRDESFEEVVIPPTYKTIQERYVSRAGGYQEWREVLCGDDLTSDRIRRIQVALKAEGYDPGPVDNILGSQTKAALKKFQMENGLPVGNLDRETMRVLGID